MTTPFIVGIILLVLYVILNVCDFITTYLGITKYGAYEANVIVDKLLEYGGWIGFAIVKVIVTIGVSYILFTTNPIVYLIILTILSILYAVVCWNNYQVIKQEKEKLWK